MQEELHQPRRGATVASGRRTGPLRSPVLTVAGMEEKLGEGPREGVGRKVGTRLPPPGVLTVMALMLALRQISGDEQEESPDPSGLRTDSDDRDELLASGPQNPLHPVLLPTLEPSKMHWLQVCPAVQSLCPGVDSDSGRGLVLQARQHG